VLNGSPRFVDGLLGGHPYKDVRTEGEGGYGPMRTKADKGREVDFYFVLRTSFMSDPLAEG